MNTSFFFRECHIDIDNEIRVKKYYPIYAIESWRVVHMWMLLPVEDVAHPKAVRSMFDNFCFRRVAPYY